MSIINRLENIRDREGLNKAQFERRLSKSTGYLNMLVKRNSNPGVDVIETFAKEFPHYSLDWLLTGKGKMLKNPAEISTERGYDNHITSDLVEELRQDLKGDLRAIADGMTKNFEVITEGILQGLRGQQKIHKFIDQLNPDEISRACSGLDEFLKKQEP